MTAQMPVFPPPVVSRFTASRDDGTRRNDEKSRLSPTRARRILDSYLSELRHEIAATKRGTSRLHEEEDAVTGLQKKVSELK